MQTLHNALCLPFVRIALPLLCLLCTPEYLSARCLDAPEGKRIGLVLSGGGARGTAHVGVLEVLEELRIPVHCIAGTSLGAVVGGLYALGFSAAGLEHVVRTVDWNRGFVDEFPRRLLPLRRKDEEDEFLLKFELGVSNRTLTLPRGVIQGHGLHLLLKELLGGASLVRDFDALPIPFRAVATDIVDAQPVPLAGGDLARSIQASMAIPGVYAPVEINRQQLVDGGVTLNLPVSVVREMGADIVIAIDIGTPLSRREQLQSVVSILDQLTNVLTDRNVKQEKASLHQGDIYIQPDLGPHTTMDFASAASIVEIGRLAAWNSRRELSSLSLDAESYQRYRRGLESLPVLPTRLSQISLNQTSKLSSEVLVQRLKAVDSENRFDIVQLHQSLDALYSTGLYERVTYDYQSPDPGNHQDTSALRQLPDTMQGGSVVVASLTGEEMETKTGIALQVNAEAKTWGPDLIRFGFSLEDDFGGNNNFNVSMGYIRKAINSLGGDLRAVGQIGETPRALVEYFQPLRALSEFYTLASFEHQQYSQGEFAGGEQTGQFRTRRNEFGFFLGRQFDNHSDLRIGAATASGRVQRRVGDESLNERDDFTEGALLLGYRFDTLDSIRFPSEGNRVRLNYESSHRELGADDEYDAVSFDALSAGLVGKNRWVLSLAFQTATRNSLPAQKLFKRGGLLNTSGLSQDVEVGQHTGRVTGVWYRPLDSQKIAALDYPVYYGLSIGLGGVFQQRREIEVDNLQFAGNIFIAADTPAGPVFLGFGAAEAEGFSALLSLGVTF